MEFEPGNNESADVSLTVKSYAASQVVFQIRSHRVRMTVYT